MKNEATASARAHLTSPDEEVDAIRADPPEDDGPFLPEEIEPVVPSERPHHRPNLSPFANLRHDLPGGLVAFLVAVPLCLGIALASGAPALSGILAGIVGGLVIPLLSRSELSVSGPAAGLAAVVAVGITKVGSFETFTLAVMLGGLLQIAFGFVRAGTVAYFVPSSVIQGMLTAIGLLLILKQIPHAVGYNHENFASMAFRTTDDENTFSLFYHALASIKPGAVVISVCCIVLLIAWEKTPRLKRLTFLPGPLVAVFLGVGLEMLLRHFTDMDLDPKHLVQLPIGGANGSLLQALRLPKFSAITSPDTWFIAVTIAAVASLETLLNVEAIDKLDPYHRKSPLNRELVAQGVANTISGLIGGLPITSVVVRSSAALGAGARTRAAAFIHGVLMLLSVMLAASLLNRIPLACLAAILLMTGYKLAKPAVFKAAYRAGFAFFVPFASTVLAILFTDLLKGAGIGLLLGVAFSLYRLVDATFLIENEGTTLRIRILGHAHFFSRWRLVSALEHAKEGSLVVFEAEPGTYIDRDVTQLIQGFVKSASARKIKVELRGMTLDDFPDLAH